MRRAISKAWPDVARHAVLGLVQLELACSTADEELAVLGAVDRLDRGADQRRLARGAGRAARLSGVWPPNCTMMPSGCHLAHDVHHVLVRQRLEEEQVRGVVVGRDRLGVRVDHDRLAPDLLDREGGVHAAVVELDALADAVRAAAQDHDLLRGRELQLVLVLPGRVVVGRVGLELGRRRCRRSCTSARGRTPRAARATSCSVEPIASAICLSE